jgi:hypothetical protein
VVELVSQYSSRLDRTFDGNLSMTVIVRKVKSEDIYFDVSSISNDDHLKSSLKLSPDQLSRVERIIADLESSKKRVAKDAVTKSHNDSPKELHDRFQKEVVRIHREMQEKLAAIWSTRQARLLDKVQKRSRLLALGWEQVLESLDNENELALTAEQWRQWKELHARWRKEIRSRRQMEQSAALPKFLQLLEPEQQTALAKWLRQTDEDLPAATLPCIEVWQAQLETAANSGIDTSQDPLDALRVEWVTTLSGGLRVERQARCIALELASSCLHDDQLEMVSLQFDDLVKEVRDPQSASGAELSICDRQIESIKRRMLSGKLDMEQAGTEMSNVFVKKDEIVWRALHKIVIPSQAEQLDRLLVEREFQNVGIGASLLDGTLGKKIRASVGDRSDPKPKAKVENGLRKTVGVDKDEMGRRQIKEYSKNEARRVKNLAIKWEIEVTSDVENILSAAQRAHLLNEFAAFDRDAILVGNPELLFADRTLLNQAPSSPNRERR